MEMQSQEREVLFLLLSSLLLLLPLFLILLLASPTKIMNRANSLITIIYTATMLSLFLSTKRCADGRRVEAVRVLRDVEVTHGDVWVDWLVGKV